MHVVSGYLVGSLSMGCSERCAAVGAQHLTSMMFNKHDVCMMCGLDDPSLVIMPCMQVVQKGGYFYGRGVDDDKVCGGVLYASSAVDSCAMDPD